MPLLIKKQEHLDRLCESAARYDQLAIDTEFVRTNTYAPRLGLVQIAAEDSIACVDPLTDMDMSPLWNLLFDPARASILHSGSQDMEVLWHTCGKVIPRLIDTQICSALLGYPAQIGYAGLAAELVKADIAKSQTRTDWSKRPLTDAQLHYAAEDVEHLMEMHEILKQRLIDLGRYEWALEDSRELSNTDLYKPAPDKAWQRLKSIPFQPPEQQARARALAAWREQRAVTIDKPRGWILSDKALLQLADRNPDTLHALNNIEDLPNGIIRKQGKKLLALLAEANRALAAGDVSYRQISPDRDKEKALGKRLSAIVREAAEKLDIANEVLASKRDIQALISGDSGSRILSGWRFGVIGEAMLAEVPSSPTS